MMDGFLYDLTGDEANKLIRLLHNKHIHVVTGEKIVGFP